ncbi:AmmeMemoRadiSam system protein A [Candidatus Bipolaricaulota bacterium]|nr:AmmeMemoRadiSam system protein A [Candidatus Bipolaricaulota bacterium]
MPRSRKGNFWVRFILGFIVVAFVWFFAIRPNTIELSWSEQEQLLGLAREQMVSSLTNDGLIDIYPPGISERSLRDGAAFVSLTVDGALRGCMIDQFQPHEPLVVNVLRNTELAVRGDDRFQRLTPEEIERARIAISVVYDVEPLSFEDERDLLRRLEPDRDGVILAIDQDIATYLPSVWQTFPDPAEFLSQLCIKAGWDANRWRMQPYPTISTYHVFAFEEPE